MSEKRLELLEECATILREAEGEVRVLRTIGWSKDVAQRFFARGATEPPEVTYTPLDATPVVEAVEAVRARLDRRDPDHGWLLRQAQSIELGAHMLASVGTKRFFEYSCELYGQPKAPILDGETTALALAEQLDRVLAQVGPVELGATPTSMTAEALARRMRRLAKAQFGAESPEIELVDELSAKAVAGPRRVRLRRDAEFTDQDLRQLLSHEVYVHVATSMNGRLQRSLPILAAGHPGTTRTQEGLAVFSEIIGGAIDPSRFRRLADRAIAIQRSIDGADFLELYAFFLERGDDPEQAFEDTRRVVRGGLVHGGGPFTKDGVYLDGLLRVHNFLRTAILLGRGDAIPILFVGKLDLEDVPDLLRLSREGTVLEPKYLPPWAKDRQFLVSYLAYSGFLNLVRLEAVQQHYAAMLGA